MWYHLYMFRISTDENGNSILEISARRLAEFSCRSGDITSGGSFKDPLLLMREGSRVHRKIQNSYGSSYKSELSLSFLFDSYGLDLLVKGRADGVSFINSSDGEELPSFVDEIKGVYADVEAMDEPLYIHLAQAYIYAFILCRDYCLSSIGVQMTYVSLDDGNVKKFYETKAFSELEEFIEKVLSGIRPFCSFTFEWLKKRDLSIKPLEFPYEYRSGQRELVSDVYRTILRSKNLFIEAPTGTGKTLSVIFPSVKAVGEKLIKRIYYLTSKNITRTAAFNAISILGENGMRMKVIEITAKEKLCPNPGHECDGSDCIFAGGFYDKVRDVMIDVLNGYDIITSDILNAVALKNNICPYYLSLELSDWCDMVICDINYYFDPKAYLKRFFADGQTADSVLLIDEAHNLVDRGREMYSASIRKSSVLIVRKIIKPLDKRLYRALSRLNERLLELRKNLTGQYEYLPDRDALVTSLLSVRGAFDRFLLKNDNIPEKNTVMDFYFSVRSFLDTSELFDENYICYKNPEGKSDITVKLFCINPSKRFENRISYARSSVFFSATFLPIGYYKNLISPDNEPYCVYAKSVFDKKQSLILVADDVTSRYKERTDDMYSRYAKYIDAMVKSRTGNYIAFFPSYLFLEKTKEKLYLLREDRYDIIEQKRVFTEEEKLDFLKRFETVNDKSLLALTCLGGIFSEGIDLPGDRLIGAAVVGTGLPQVCSERDIIMNYFNGENGSGFLYSYLYPGMAKVCQAAGRVIRTADDRGVILLLDKRFNERQYLLSFPREWEDRRNTDLYHVTEELKNFWEKS